MIKAAIICTLLPLLAICRAQCQPQLIETSWSQSDESFMYRSFAGRKVKIVGLPVVIDENVSYFKSRRLDYMVEGESSLRGQIMGTDESGTTRFEGSYLKNTLTGPARTFHTNGNTRDSGMLLMNLPDGEWKFFQSDGTLKTIRQYNAYLWWSIQWSIQLDNPFWNKFHLSDLYKKRPASFYKAVIADETFNNQYSAPFYYCIQHGKSVNYHANGSIADSGNYYQGMLDGVWISYHENGVIREMGAYKMGERIGHWKRQYPSGKMAALIEYKQDRVIQIKEYEE
jgi:antitoxin component YwqK of YwqJK toxin-antitoxin module